MNSLWKDLLFLHGHITHVDPDWLPDARSDKDRPEPPAKKVKAIVATCCAAAWPRLVQPR